MLLHCVQDLGRPCVPVLLDGLGPFSSMGLHCDSRLIFILCKWQLVTTRTEYSVWAAEHSQGREADNALQDSGSSSDDSACLHFVPMEAAHESC